MYKVFEVLGVLSSFVKDLLLSTVLNKSWEDLMQPVTALPACIDLDKKLNSYFSNDVHTYYIYVCVCYHYFLFLSK